MSLDHIALQRIADLERQNSDLQAANNGLLERARKAELECNRLGASRDKFRDAEKKLSDAYIRLRAIIPGALEDRSHLSAEQMWASVEECAISIVTKAASAPKAGDRQRAQIDALEAVLGKAMELIVDVGALISRGQSERATDEIKKAQAFGWSAIGWARYRMDFYHPGKAA